MPIILSCRSLLSKGILSALLVLPLALSAQEMPFSLSRASQCPKYETRAVWITVLNGLDWPATHALSPESIAKQQQELCEQLDYFKAAHFNTILMQTRIRGDVIYPSPTEPYSEALTGTHGKAPGYDPLAFAVEECHRRGMECHAWVVAIPIGSDKHVRQQGKASVVKKRPSLCMHYRGYWYLNPGHPETKDYLLSVAKEIVTRYDIDGINFDYIRYPDGRTQLPDQATFRRYGKGKSLAQWRRDNLTEIMRHIYAGIKEIKPYVKVGSSPLGKYKDTGRYSSKGWNAYHTVFQDAQGWLKEGIQDIVFPMLYFRENNFYPFASDWKEHSCGRTVAPGLGVYFLEEAGWPLGDIERQIGFTRSIRASGQAYFRAKFLLKDCAGVSGLIHKAYPYPALTPPMSWQDSIPPSSPEHLSVKEEEGKIKLSWEASRDNSARSERDSGIRYHVYASATRPADTRLPQNLIATNLKDTCYTVEAKEGEKLYFAVTATDCYGNESGSLVPAGPHEKAGSGYSRTLPVKEIPQAACLTVADAYGREVRHLPYRQALDLSGLANGAYTLKITGPDGTVLHTELFMKTE